MSSTREKQMQLWKDLITNFQISKNEFIMTPSDFPLFENREINRKLNSDFVDKLVVYLIKTG